MSAPHDHMTHVNGCFRCELGNDEAVAAEVYNAVHEQVKRLSEEAPAVAFLRVGYGWALVRGDA